MNTKHRPSAPLRWYLLLLAAGTLLPMVLLSAVVIQRVAHDERIASQRRLFRTSRDLAWAVDRELTSTIRTLSALAQTSTLDSGDTRAFLEEARRAAATQPTWNTLILLSPDGRQLVNTSRPSGAHGQRVNEPASLRELIATGQPVVGSLARGKIKHEWAFPVRVPVKRNGRIRFVLTAVITPKALLEVTQGQARTEGEWTRSVVDGNGHIVLRTRDPERFIGRMASRKYMLQVANLRRTNLWERSVVRDTTLDGVDVYRAVSPIGRWNWTAGVAVPVVILEAPGRRAEAVVLALGAFLLLLSAGAAYVLARRITRAIAGSAAAAQALTRGERPIIESTRLAEVDSLGESLQTSFDLLEQRERERDENLAHAEEARKVAEEAQQHAEEAQLLAEESSRLKDEFLATVSHELRTPLTAILGWAHLLRTGHVPKADEAATLQTVERNARALSGLVDDLLDASRIINGNLTIAMDPVDLSSILEDAVDTMRAVAEPNDIELSAEVERPVVVYGDRRRLLQIVLNILANAVKFTQPGGKVAAELSVHDGNARLTVCDTGEGIDPDFLPHMFDRFRQADGSTTRRAGGLGLGLSIVRNLLELHGGTVAAASEGIGKGSVFTVTLPLAPAGVQPASVLDSQE